MKTTLFYPGLCCILIGFIFSSCYYDNKESLFQYVQTTTCDTVTTATFALDIVPLLISHCNRCHSNDRQDGGVNLEGYTEVKPYIDDGSLFGTTNHEAGFPVMPTSGIKIPVCDVEKMRVWIAEGALDN